MLCVIYRNYDTYKGIHKSDIPKNYNKPLRDELLRRMMERHRRNRGSGSR